jgi:hypothetical protein
MELPEEGEEYFEQTMLMGRQPERDGCSFQCGQQRCHVLYRHVLNALQAY